jgi:hypothetical protein
MPRRMPGLNVSFSLEVARATQLAQAGELVRAGSPPKSLARRELTPTRLEALYEAAYLRLFLAWETFLEQTFHRYLCGQVSALGGCALTNPPYPNLVAAEVAVLDGHDFVSWADATKVVRRSRKYMVAGFHETVLLSDQARLGHYQSIRNRVAHPSQFARNQFDAATRSLALRRYSGSSPGRFLRDKATMVPYPKVWLEVIADELVSLANQICT